MTYDVHLICGGTGAGKSTYAQQLATDIGGIRFSIDEWMHRLYFVDKPPEADFNWFYERVQRSCALMRDMAEKQFEIGVPVVFDCGLTNKAERQIFYDWAADNAFTPQLHFIDTDTTLRWQRTQHRNETKGPTFAFEVTRFMFDFMNDLWEGPTDEEMTTYHGQRIGN